MVDFFAAAQRVISILMSGSEISIIVWLVSGGIIYVLRGISFWIDTLLVNFIDSVYGYFMKLLSGTMFNEAVTDQLLTNVYVFIGVVVFFRLAMLIIKYLMNPEMISDEKAGVNSLIKRVIIGMCGIIAIPTIFEKATELQAAIINDQIIQQIIIPSDMIDATSNKAAEGGKFIGTYVFAGFINPSTKASKDIKKEYTVALERGDLSSIDFNSGGFLGIGYTDYDYSYFYLVSTFVLAYVLYLMIKYCLDIVVRFFKLLLYQLMAPIAMVEYMINGSENGAFKSWKSAVLSTYFMLFVRVLAIWFVVFVMTLMSGEYSVYSDTTLLADNDYLLRALIIIGLLGFMMDLPKLVGNIFGLDLEQESSATGVLKSFGGVLKGVGMGALTMGGAAAGGAFGAAKAGLHGTKEMAKLKADYKSGNMTRDQYNQKAAEIKANSKSARHAANMGALKGVGKSAMHAVGLGAVNRSFAEASGEVDKEESKQKQKAAQAEEQMFRQHQMQVTDQINVTNQAIQAGQTISNYKLGELIDTSGANLQETRNINVKLGTNVNVDSAETMKKANDAFASGGFSYQDTVAGKQDQTISETQNVNVKLGTNVNVDSAGTMQKANDAFASGGFSYQDTIAGKQDQTISETQNVNVKLGTNVNVDSAGTMQKANDAFASGGFNYQDTVNGKLDEINNSINNTNGNSNNP